MSWPGRGTVFGIEVVESTEESVFSIDTLYLVLMESRTWPSEIIAISRL